MKRIALRITLLVALALTIIVCVHSQNSRGDEPQRPRISCVNNLQQIGIAFHVWGPDYNYRFPWQVSTNEGGTKELCQPDKDGFDLNSFRHFQVMSNELSTPLVLICPSDRQKKPAANFGSLAASNVSYRIHVVPGLWLRNTKKIPLIVCPADGSILYYDGSIKAGNPN